MIPVFSLKIFLLSLCVLSSVTLCAKRITLDRKERSIGHYPWYNSVGSYYGQSNDLTSSPSGQVYFPSNHLSPTPSYYSPYGHQYPPGYSIHSDPVYPNNFGHPYQPYTGLQPQAIPEPQAWPSSLPAGASSAKLTGKDSEPKFVGRGHVTALPGGSHDLTCTFGDPNYKVISNAAWVKVIGPYNYHEPIPPFECNQPDCSLLYINGAQNLRFRVLTTGSVSTLRIYETQPADRGVYRCTVTGITPDGTTHTLYQIVEFIW